MSLATDEPMLFPLSQPCRAVEQKEADGMGRYIWCGQILLACGEMGFVRWPPSQVSSGGCRRGDAASVETSVTMEFV